MVWAMIVIFLLGASMGCAISKITSKPKTVGSLRIDNSDPEDGPYLFLELEESPDILKYEKYIYLEVNTKSYLSQK